MSFPEGSSQYLPAYDAWTQWRIPPYQESRTAEKLQKLPEALLQCLINGLSLAAIIEDPQSEFYHHTESAGVAIDIISKNAQPKLPYIQLFYLPTPGSAYARLRLAATTPYDAEGTKRINAKWKQADQQVGFSLEAVVFEDRCPLIISPEALHVNSAPQTIADSITGLRLTAQRNATTLSVDFDNFPMSETSGKLVFPTAFPLQRQPQQPAA